MLDGATGVSVRAISSAIQVHLGATDVEVGATDVRGVACWQDQTTHDLALIRRAGSIGINDALSSDQRTVRERRMREVSSFQRDIVSLAPFRTM